VGNLAGSGGGNLPRVEVEDMFEPGSFVAEHVEPTRADQIQPNGVDLTLDAVFEQVGTGTIGREGTEIGERRERDPAESDETETFTLSPGGYVAGYAETVRIPAGHVGFVYPRSSLMRNSCMLDTAVWDAGYEGRGEGLLEVYHELEIERGARIAQLVLAEAGHAGTYDGSYQGENL
jgi:dUTP pyrophosphatase